MALADVLAEPAAAPAKAILSRSWRRIALLLLCVCIVVDEQRAFVTLPVVPQLLSSPEPAALPTGEFAFLRAPVALAFVIAARAQASPLTLASRALALNLRSLHRLYPDAPVIVVNNGGLRHSSVFRSIIALSNKTRVVLVENEAGDVSGFEFGGYAAAVRALLRASSGATPLRLERVVFMQQTMVLVNPLPSASHAFQALFSFGPNFFDDFDPHQRATVGSHLLRAANSSSATLHCDEPSGAIDFLLGTCPGVFGTSFILSGSCLHSWVRARLFEPLVIAIDSKGASQMTERLMSGLGAVLCDTACGEGGDTSVEGNWYAAMGKHGDDLDKYEAEPHAYGGRRVLKVFGSTAGSA